MRSHENLLKKQNLLLAALPPADLKKLEAQGDRITPRLGDVLFESGHESFYVYFPIDSVVSLLQDFEVGGLVETAIVGNEGVVGLHNLFGIRVASQQAVVQASGAMIRLKAGVAMAEFARGGPFQQLVLRYAESLLVQIGQTAACNRLHTVDRRLARWLLAFHDRIEADQLTLTQEFLAIMLGSRRAGVNEAVGKLTRLSLIEHTRNRIRIINREGLETFACECYAAVNDHYERSLGFGFSKQAALPLAV